MKVAQFITHFPYPEQFSAPDLAGRYVCSGGEIAAYKLALHLGRLGHEVSVHTSSMDGRSALESVEGIRVYRYPSLCAVGETQVSVDLLRKPGGDAWGADLAHVHHTTPPGGLAALFYVRRENCPLVVTHHGFERYDGYGSLVRRLFVFVSAHFYVDVLLRRATAIITLSPDFAVTSRFLGKYMNKTVTIPNGVDLEEFDTSLTVAEARARLNLTQSARHILYVGSLVPRKGVDVLLRAMSLVRGEFPDADLVVVGRGPLEGSLRGLTRDLGLERHVHFVGYVPDSPTKAMYYRAADVLVVPSVNDMEMFPLVLLEGAAARCPMVVSDLGTFRCVVRDGHSGVVTKAGDGSSLADGIVRVLTDERLRARLAKEAGAIAQEHSWSVVARRTHSLYEALLQSGRWRKRNGAMP